MAKKAIFAQAELAFWIDVAAKLGDNYGWEICYVVGSKDKEKISKLFPNAVFHYKPDALRNIAPDECKGITPSPLDEKLLSSLSHHESIFLKMMDRHNYDGSLSYYNRISMYHSQIMYWKGVLEHYRPDVVVYRIAPHGIYDYALYALSRIMDIPTVMFERTSLPGFIYPVRSFEEGSEIIRRKYTEELEKDNKNEVSLTPATASHLENLSKTYAEAMPLHLKYKLNHFKKSGEVAGTVSILLRAAKCLPALINVAVDGSVLSTVTS